MERCAKCGGKRRDGALYSPLGEPVCSACHSAVTGAAIGMMTGQGLGGAIAQGYVQDGKPAGILAWVRRALDRKP